MSGDSVEAETVQAFGRTFVKGNVPEINEVRCLGCGNCVELCSKLGPNVLEVVDGVAKPVRPDDCIGDGACMVSCPTKAIFLMSSHDPDNPPESV